MAGCGGITTGRVEQCGCQPGRLLPDVGRFARTVGNAGIDRRCLEGLFVALIGEGEHLVGVGDARAVGMIAAVGLKHLGGLWPVFEFKQGRGAIEISRGDDAGGGCDGFDPQEVEHRLSELTAFAGNFALFVDAGRQLLDRFRPFFSALGHEVQRCDKALLGLRVLLERVVAVGGDRPRTAHQVFVGLARVGDDALRNLDGLVVALQLVQVFGRPGGDPQRFAVVGKGIGEAQRAGDGELQGGGPGGGRLRFGMPLIGQHGGMTGFGRAFVRGVVVGGAFVLARGVERLAAIEQRFAQQEVHLGDLLVAGIDLDDAPVVAGRRHEIGRLGARLGGVVGGTLATGVKVRGQIAQVPSKRGQHLRGGGATGPVGCVGVVGFGVALLLADHEVTESTRLVRGNDALLEVGCERMLTMTLDEGGAGIGRVGVTLPLQQLVAKRGIEQRKESRITLAREVFIGRVTAAELGEGQPDDAY